MPRSTHGYDSDGNGQTNDAVRNLTKPDGTSKAVAEQATRQRAEHAIQYRAARAMAN